MDLCGRVVGTCRWCCCCWLLLVSEVKTHFLSILSLCGGGGDCLGQVLYGLQVFWFSLIVRMAYRIFVKGDILEDIRSGDDEDDGEELHKKEN